MDGIIPCGVTQIGKDVSEIKDIDTQAFALLLGGIGRDFAKDSNIKKLISSPEQSANSITEIILNGIKLDKDYD